MNEAILGELGAVRSAVNAMDGAYRRRVEQERAQYGNRYPPDSVCRLRRARLHSIRPPFISVSRLRPRPEILALAPTWTPTMGRRRPHKSLHRLRSKEERCRLILKDTLTRWRGSWPYLVRSESASVLAEVRAGLAPVSGSF